MVPPHAGANNQHDRIGQLVDVQNDEQQSGEQVANCYEWNDGLSNLNYALGTADNNHAQQAGDD